MDGRPRLPPRLMTLTGTRRQNSTAHSGHCKTSALDTWFHPKDDCAPVELGAIMDLGGWLRSLGLERYEAIFRENAIDDTVLPDLTDQDLEKLGVLLGHRRRLLRAIANLENTE